MGRKPFKEEQMLYPADLGYRMPAEWERHEATWLSWPHDLETWPDQLAEVEAIHLEVIEHLHEGEKVHVLVNDGFTEKAVSKKLHQRGLTNNIFLHQIETDSIWIRDYGPIFLIGKSRRLAVSKWLFNAWGMKYDSFEKDNQVPDKIVQVIQAQEFRTDVVLEGGSIDVNGLGTCLTTEQCLLNPNRHPNLSREEMERYLKDFLGLRSLIWLGEGIKGDDTDGHVDQAARFVAPRRVVVAIEEEPHDQNFDALKQNWERLCHSVDQDGNPLEVVNLPAPEKIEHQGVRLPASYANFYIANASVLVPIYRCKNDATALGILRDLFPDRNVVGIPCIPLIYGLGAIHCMTQQQPAQIG